MRKTGPVAPVAVVPDDLDRRERPEQFGRPIGRAVVDDQDVAGIPQDLGEHRLEVRFLVVDGNGGEQSHRRIDR